MFDVDFVGPGFSYSNPFDDWFQLSFGLKVVLNLACKSLVFRDTSLLYLCFDQNRNLKRRTVSLLSRNKK